MNAMRRTAATSDPIFGSKLYQLRAKAALPLLVRQALAEKSISYSVLAEELGMPNPRNLNYVLGCIGQTIELLAKRNGSKIPPLQCIVINKNTGLPGDGIGWFLEKNRDYSKLPLAERRRIVARAHVEIFEFADWTALLQQLRIAPAPTIDKRMLDSAAAMRGGGESEDHRRLKKWIAKNPGSIGLSSAYEARNEYRLPSGDSLDVSFRNTRQWIGVEVKSMRSSEADLTRGVFQCVKYKSIMRAILTIEGSHRNCDCILAIEGKLPAAIRSLSNLLGVDVIENVRANKRKPL